MTGNGHAGEGEGQILGALIRFEHGRSPRPHVLGWREPLPMVMANFECDLCGLTGGHDIIQLSYEQTMAIVASAPAYDGKQR